MNIKKDIILYTLPDTIRGRSIHTNIIPTVCNLKNMLKKLSTVNGDYYQLKQWEKRSYQSYHINNIKDKLLTISDEEVIQLLKSHILSFHPKELGASCVDIYLIAYVAENYGPGKNIFLDYIKSSGISEKDNTAQAIWQVGKGDGIYLGLLNEDGTVMDWSFFTTWINGNNDNSETLVY
ncbi:hypothetical protein ABE65_012310 [Fictibacillus phosphorivorans]|uniref:Uncharacterized protein n=1 Tax=Fictibacillus phosphorivorans TaxID=1221500 RepID=A0A160IS51_9BACL|nr:hypothetical protein [Fictibacillus phosphorivorans]ANC79388.1 hypothetical protein ABE65_012310 [Fictibacillus phosphorivorans]